MKTVEQLHEILRQHDFCRIDAHIHTHVCDGDPEMTVENIADTARERGMTCVILNPHFHKQVSDGTTTLYTDSKEEIFVQLREEIEDYYAAHGNDLTILLATEADILSTDGITALRITEVGEKALDLVTPTVNYHPLLPLKAVEVTYGEFMGQLHGSGLYKSFVEKAGGIETVLERRYETEVNAILRCPYPCMLGHFWASHTYAQPGINWFGASPEHIDIIQSGSEKILEACKKTGAMIDLTGVRPWSEIDETVEEKRARDGFFYTYQQWFLERCRRMGVIAIPGTDSHILKTVGKTDYYRYFDPKNKV